MSDTSPADRDELRRLIAENIYYGADPVAERILAALDKAGLAIVPKKLTEAMLAAAEKNAAPEDFDKIGVLPTWRVRATLMFKDMLAASPFSVSKDDAS